MNKEMFKHCIKLSTGKNCTRLTNVDYSCHRYQCGIARQFISGDQAVLYDERYYVVYLSCKNECTLILGNLYVNGIKLGVLEALWMNVFGHSASTLQWLNYKIFQ